MTVINTYKGRVRCAVLRRLEMDICDGSRVKRPPPNNMRPFGVSPIAKLYGHETQSGQHHTKGRHGLIQMVSEPIPNRKCVQRGRWASKGWVIVTIISPYMEMVSCAVSHRLGMDRCDGL
ncbi:hypothetical protein TIFTF001_032795 [Ficus carica]|uniref:Uncharacterized protein n=1 Tax=Ficus carica TaxID=3494 RepID=A0AA88J2V7_FICCA|nr:hypothetical protein TIFTF001_032795 [Ficus carica]